MINKLDISIDRELLLPIKHTWFRQIEQTVLQSPIQASKCKAISRGCKWQLKEVKHLVSVKGYYQHHMSAFLSKILRYYFEVM